MPDLLPDSRLSRPGLRSKSAVERAGVWWVPIFCANCGCDGGLVPEENCDFAFYLCQPCADKHGAVAGTLTVPDEVFWAKVRDAQLEKYGRVLSPEEQVDLLKDGSSILSKLARGR